KASSDMEQIQNRVSSQALAVENFLATAVLEANDVIDSIHNSLDEQKQLVAFSIQQQEEEEVARDEEEALDKISTILSNLTSKRIAMVSEASRNMQDTSVQQSKKLQLEMLNLQQVSKDATKEVNEYVENANNQFVEQIFSVNNFKATMEDCLLDCSKTVDCSRKQWESAHLSFNNFHKNNLAEIESIVKKNISTNHALDKKFVSASLSMDLDCDAGTRNLLADVNGN
ncbi:125 kDa kinesin-like protein, partial [Trifolium medium]|nr:125 kDa kinesin-like protein [Trifolium medium]